ncbi:hypothetical protein, partial [Escherichia coli]|uniref:hypothetical protein n=1 Tax=Escherichia coli TaxID=562 RepID=UPI001BFC1D29
SSPSRYFSDTSLLNSNENLLIRSSVTDLVSNYWGALQNGDGHHPVYALRTVFQHDELLVWRDGPRYY